MVESVSRVLHQHMTEGQPGSVGCKGHIIGGILMVP